MIINISRNSWHYKLISFFGLDTLKNTNNLCPYMRSVVITIILATLVICSLIIFFILVVWIMFYPIFNNFFNIYKGVQYVSIWLGMFCWIFIGYVLIKTFKPYINNGKWYNKKIYLYNENEMYKQKNIKHNIFIEYIKAKYKKLCPEIKIND